MSEDYKNLHNYQGECKAWEWEADASKITSELFIKCTLARVSELPVTKTVPLALNAQQKIWWLCGPALEDGAMFLPAGINWIY